MLTISAFGEDDLCGHDVECQTLDRYLCQNKKFWDFLARIQGERREIRASTGTGNKITHLHPDPIIPLSEIAIQDSILKAMVRWEHGVPRSITIEDLQRDICDIHLIPAVPKHTRRVFEHAKKLYVFGYFRYGFFTISIHYAFLTLESAINNKYDLSLGEKVTLMNKKGETYEMGSPTPEKIFRFCRGQRGWNYRKLKVNGEDFRWCNRDLLDWLVKHNIIAKLERTM